MDMNRRSLIAGLFVAPAIIRTPNLLMPLGRGLASVYPMLEMVDVELVTWCTPLIDRMAYFRPPVPVVLTKFAVRNIMGVDRVVLEMDKPSYMAAPDMSLVTTVNFNFNITDS